MAKIKEEMAANQNDAKLAKKEAEKARKKLSQLVDELDAKSVKIGDLESKLELSEGFLREQRERLKISLDRTKDLEKELIDVRREKAEKEEALSSRIQELEEDAALARVVARAALMRRVASGTITTKMAKDEVAAFVQSMGSEDLLDEEDLKGLDEDVAIEGEKITETEGVAVEEEVIETSGSVPAPPVVTEEPPVATEEPPVVDPPSADVPLE